MWRKSALMVMSGLVAVSCAFTGTSALNPAQAQEVGSGSNASNEGGSSLLKSGYLMCVTEDALSEPYSPLRITRHDNLEEIGCYVTSEKIDGVLVERGPVTSSVHIRIPNGGSVVVYVPSEALTR